MSIREAEITRAVRTRAFQVAEKDLDYVAVVLLGHAEPVPVKVGSNATKSPVYIGVSRNPTNAPKEFDRAHAVHPVVLLAHVWTSNDAFARRLKSALDTRVLGDDPDMVALRHAWRDLPEWEVAWPILLNDAVRDLRENGDRIELMSEDIRIQRIIRHARSGQR